MTDTIFTKIIRREIPAEIIYEDGATIAIPDKFPSMRGQTLVILKRQVSYAFELSVAEYQVLMDTVRRVAQAMDKAFGTVRTCAVIEGFEVPHVHVRLYPCRTPELKLSPRYEASEEECRETAEKIRKALSAHS